MIEEVLYKHLQEKGAELGSYLATWNGKMAIFSQEAPKDTDKGWGEGSQYGRIVYAIDTNYDPERKVSGKMLVDIMCEKDQTPPEYIEPIVKELIDGYFFTDPEITMAAQWSSSNYFTDATDKVAGVTLTFDLLAFPTQLTTDLDPVHLVNEFIKELFPECKRIGIDTEPGTWKMSDDMPAAYVRLQRINPGSYPSTYHVTWYNPVMQVHFLAPSTQKRMILIKRMVETLQQKQRLIFSDGSPLMIQRLAVTMEADQLKEGQLSIEGTYGILRTYPDVPLMTNIDIK